MARFAVSFVPPLARQLNRRTRTRLQREVGSPKANCNKDRRKRATFLTSRPFRYALVPVCNERRWQCSTFAGNCLNMKLLTNKLVSRAPARQRVILMVGVVGITAALTGPALAADPVGD